MTHFRLCESGLHCSMTLSLPLSRPQLPPVSHARAIKPDERHRVVLSMAACNKMSSMNTNRHEMKT